MVQPPCAPPPRTTTQGQPQKISFSVLVSKRDDVKLSPRRLLFFSASTSGIRLTSPPLTPSSQAPPLLPRSSTVHRCRPPSSS